MRRKILLSVLLSFFGTLIMPLTARAATTTTIKPSSMDGWKVTGQAGSTGDFVVGPATPPAGSGSYRMTTGPGEGTTGGKQFLYQDDWFDKNLSDITALSYSTYIAQRTDGTVVAPAININAIINGNWTTLVYEPAYSVDNNVPLNTWQTWDTMTGKWWSTKPLKDASGVTQYQPFTSYVTFQQIKDLDPAAKISGDLRDNLQDVGGIQIVSGQNSAGSPWSNFDGNVDNVTINDTTYDFELAAPRIVNRNDCFNNGWQNLGTSNQGQCVSFLERNSNSLKTIATRTLNSNDMDGENIPVTQGKLYRVTIAGTWTNRSGEQVDAECTNWQNQGWKNEVNGGFSADLLDVQLNESFVNWGACAGNNTYTLTVLADGNNLNLRVFDGDTNTNQQIPSWFGDNNGTFNVTLYSY